MSRSGTPPLIVLSGSGSSSQLADAKPLPSDLSQRAKTADQQMRYFGLVVRKCSFSELFPSASRAGFTLVSKDPQEREARFRWALGEPDFIFSVSFKDPEKVSVVAESCGDVFGLVLVSHSHVTDISVETKPWLGSDELGPNALPLRDILLTFPDFIATPAWATY
jgi:hypothetical protein